MKFIAVLPTTLCAPKYYQLHSDANLTFFNNSIPVYPVAPRMPTLSFIINFTISSYYQFFNCLNSKHEKVIFKNHFTLGDVNGY